MIELRLEGRRSALMEGKFVLQGLDEDFEPRDA
jgi:hypothetical protein